MDPLQTSSGEVPGGPAEEPREQAAESETDSPDDLALAFRRALSKRGRASADEPSPGGEHREAERSVETSPEAEARASTEESTPLVSASPFLWVTDAPSDASGVLSIEELSEPRARQAEAFLLRGDGDRPYRLLQRIRGHSEASVYLKPVFWRRAEGERSPVADHVDGTWTSGADEKTLDALREQAATINKRVSALIEPEGTEVGNAERRVLQFVATRSAEFAPRRGEDQGIVYPKLTPLLEQSSQIEDLGGHELAEILSATAQHIREKQSSRS